MKKKYVLIVALALGALTAAYYAGLIRLNHPTPREFPVRGIDVSHHQKQIGWYEASLNDVRFAYLKASEGGDFSDREFLFNWQQCERWQIACGAYHFVSFCRSGEEQARQFLARVPPGGTLPPALDLEFSGNCKKTPTRSEMVRLVSDFSKTIAQRYPGPPVLYMDGNFYKRYFEGHRADYPAYYLWIRNVVRQPALKPCEDWTFWQYADHARIPGILGPVDLNVFCGSADDFSLFLGKARRGIIKTEIP